MASSTDRLEKTVVLDAPRSRVWRAISDVAQFNQWFGVRLEAPFTPGAEIKGRITYPGYEHLEMMIWIDRVDPEHFFSFRWHPNATEEGVDYSREPKTLVAFTLEDSGANTKLTIVESGFDAIPESRRGVYEQQRRVGGAAEEHCDIPSRQSPVVYFRTTRRARCERRAPRLWRMPHRPRTSRQSTDELITAAVGATIFATLGVCAHHDLLDDVNQRVRDMVLRRGPRAVRLARAITLLSESAVHPVLGLLLSRSASRVLGQKTGVPLAASLSHFIVNKGTRLFVHQQRPPGAKPRTGIDRLGYPSGHTLAATAIAFSTALRVAEGRASQRPTLLFAAAAYAGLIGWTRLTLDEHWLDDVVGAWAGGIALAIIVTRADRARRGRNRRVRELVDASDRATAHTRSP